MQDKQPLSEVRTEDLMLLLGPKGPERAYAELVKRYLPLVYHTCLRQLRDPHQAEDAAQGVFLLLQNKAPSFPNEAACSTWLYRAAILTCKRLRRDEQRRQRREGKLAAELDLFEAPQNGEEDKDEWHEMQGLLDEAIQSLSPRLRETLILRFLRGYSEAETAEALSCPVGTVSSRINTSMKKLRDFFKRRGYAASSGAVIAGLSVLPQQVPAAVGGQLEMAATLGQHSAQVMALSDAVGRSMTLAQVGNLTLWSGLGLSGLIMGILSLVSALAPPVPDVSIGFRGNGQGHFAGTDTPALQWDEAQQQGIHWSVDLPNWGGGSPVVVGDRVYVVCEPGKVSAQRTILFPLLVCLDRRDGRILWEREIDHLGDDDLARVRWRQVLEQVALGNALFYDKFTKQDPAADKRAADAGITLPRRGGRHARVLIKYGNDDAVADLRRQYGLDRSVWHCWGLYIGNSFPTPCSDGESIYVVTANRTVASYDKDGNQRWLHWDERTPSSANRSTLFVSSPLLVRDTLIVHGNNRLRAFDKDTGYLRWDVATDVKPYMVGSPVRLTLSGTDVIFTASGEVVRVADGHVLARGIGRQGNGAGPVTDGRDVVFITNGTVGGPHRPGQERFSEVGTMALRLSLKDEELQVRQLWHNVHRCAHSGERTPLYHAGRLYMGDHATVLDAESGNVLWFNELEAGASRHAINLAGGHLYTLGDDGVTAVLDLQGSVLHTNTLQVAPNIGDKLQQRIYQVGGQAGDGKQQFGEWPFTFSLPFFAGRQAFIRSNDKMYCLGAP